VKLIQLVVLALSFLTSDPPTLADTIETTIDAPIIDSATTTAAMREIKDIPLLTSPNSESNNDVPTEASNTEATTNY